VSRIFWNLILVFIPLSILFGIGYWFLVRRSPSPDRSKQVFTWLRNPLQHQEWARQAGERCNDAPFEIPTDGFIGFIWADSFRIGHHHQGIDIFSGTDVNVTPVYAAFAGYLTRLPDWKASVIIRIPDDPLHPGRQIWAYYTHMAGPQGVSYISEKFPSGSLEVPVEPGELLGYQGNYSGDPGNPVGVHLHFSIVKDDGEGQWLNELEIQNTLDPSPYLGLPLNAHEVTNDMPVCTGPT
jgi:murein DD-endopeptidase MepM/ murein hydrolase activator NlpD